MEMRLRIKLEIGMGMGHEKSHKHNDFKPNLYDHDDDDARAMCVGFPNLFIAVQVAERVICGMFSQFEKSFI